MKRNRKNVASILGVRMCQTASEGEGYSYQRGTGHVHMHIDMRMYAHMKVRIYETVNPVISEKM